MPARAIATSYGPGALATLRTVVAAAKADDPMAPVTVLVPNNVSGIVARRHLAAGVEQDSPGIAALFFETLSRLAERLAAAQVAPRRPATRPIVGAALRGALADDPGVFVDVAAHPATIRALTQAHRELRDLSEPALQAISPGSTIAPDLLKVHRSATAQLADAWYDDVDLVLTAADLVRSMPSLVDELGTLVLYLPQDLTQAQIAFSAALAEHAEMTVVAGLTGVRRADGAVLTTLERLGLTVEDPERHPRPTASHIMHSSDADDEVRCVVRDVVATVETTPAHRIAILYSNTSPYSRLLHEQLAAARIAVNGAGTRAVDERSVARLLTQTLALVDGDLPRARVFEALSNIPANDFAGNRIPIARWERTSRSAGVVSGADWETRLTLLIAGEQAAIDEQRESDDPWQSLINRAERTIAAATELRAFAVELRMRLVEAQSLDSWTSLGRWCADLFHALVGEGESLYRLPAEEQHAAAAVEQTLQGLSSLDSLGAPADLQALREILDSELSSSLPRVGRFGDGVFVAPLSAAIGLDVDVAYIIGLAEDLYPGRFHENALLPEHVRRLSGGELPSHRESLHAKQRHLLAAFAAGGARCVASFPRGDLRRSSRRLPSRWLLPTLRELADDKTLAASEWETADYRGAMAGSGSFATTLLGSDHLAHEQEWRVRGVAAGQDLHDPTIDLAVEMIHARAGSDFTRFDGNLTGVTGLPNYAVDDRAVSPTALESFSNCPHAFFVGRLLGVSQLEQPEALVIISPAEIGNLVHASLDRLVHEYPDDLPSHGQPWNPAQRVRLIAIAEGLATEFESRGLTGHPRLWEREKRRVLSDLIWMLDDDNQWRQGLSARVETSELPFGMSGEPPVEIVIPGGRVLMRGSADKVDIGSDGTIYVTDVKTGSASKFAGISEDDPVVRGTKLQLPVYAHAARQRFGDRATPVEAMYWFVRRDRGRVQVPLTPDVEAVYADTLATIVASIAAGLFPAKAPEKPDWAWVQCEYCNPDGIGHADVRRRWERKRHDPALADYVRLAEPEAFDAERPSS